jgi:Tfp pilus assembly protein PilO
MSLTQALGWWRARALREKLLLIGGSLGLLLAGTDALLTAPLEKRLKRTRAEVQALDEKLQRLLPGTDPSSDPRTLEATLRERLEQARLRNAQLRRQLADAARLPETLRAITATVGSARLLELDLSGDAEPTRTASTPAATAATAAARVSGTATATTAAASAAAGAAIDGEFGPGAPRLYRLPITLKVAGSYGELQTLLTQIERHAQALQWSQLTLDNSEWPAIQLTLRAHVLSTGPRWGAS